MNRFSNQYIDGLIRDILTEDVGYGSNNFTFLTSQKSLDNKASKKMDKAKTVFRLPNKNEINASGIESSDYQLPALTVYSFVMTQLGLTNRGAVRSKKIPLTKANTREVNRYKTILSSVISYFGKNEPVELFYDSLQHSLNAENEKLGINLASVFDTLKTWSNLNDKNKLLQVIAAFVRGKYGSDSKETDRKAFNSLNNGINNYADRHDDAYIKSSGRKMKQSGAEGAGEYTPSDMEVQMVKKIFKQIQPIIRAGEESGKTPKAYIKLLTNADSFKSILREPVMDGIRKNIMSFKGTCGKFANYILKYLASQEKGSEKVHAKTVIDTDVRNKLNEIGKEMKAAGMKDGVTLPNFIKYEVKNNPSGAEFLEKTLGCSAKEIAKKFSSFDEFNNALYSPENIKKIYGDLKVNVRARSKGDVRKGRALQVDARALNKQIANLERKAEAQKDIKGKVDAATVDQIHNLKKKAKEIVDTVKNDRIKDTGDDTDLHSIDDVQKKFDTHEEEIEYMTWAFDVFSKRSDTLNFIAKKLHKILDNYNKYINIDAYDSNNNEKATTFVVDYPKASKVYKAFRDKPEITDQIIMWIEQELKKELKKNIRFDLESGFVNVPQEESFNKLDNGESPEDAWEGF